MAAIRQIVTEEDPKLHEASVEVRRFNAVLHNLMDDMKKTMYYANGVGLAAPQVGVNKCVIVADDGETGFVEMVNPRIVEQHGQSEATEYCLSVPDRGGVVRRATGIRVEYQDRFGEPHTMSANKWQARVLQHEIDHLSGTLFTDIMLREVRGDEDDD